MNLRSDQFNKIINNALDGNYGSDGKIILRMIVDYRGFYEDRQGQFDVDLYDYSLFDPDTLKRY